MAMSRKDYEATARILANTRKWSRGRANTAPTIDTIMRELADMFAADNPRFDRQRFYVAAQLRNTETQA